MSGRSWNLGIILESQGRVEPTLPKDDPDYYRMDHNGQSLRWHTDEFPAFREMHEALDAARSSEDRSELEYTPELRQAVEYRYEEARAG
jgi:hypothetical protein